MIDDIIKPKSTCNKQQRFNQRHDQLTLFFQDYTPQVTKSHVSLDRIDPLLEIETFVQECIKEDHAGFQIYPDHTPRLRYRPSKFAHHYYSRIRNWMDAYTANRFYSPSVDLFFRTCIDLRIAHEPLLASHDLSSDGAPHALRFNALITRIHQDGRSKHFQNRLCETRSRAKAQFIQWAVHIDHLFDEIRSRITVIRLDFSYRRECSPWIEPEQADADFKRFVGNLKGKRSLFDDLLAYFWKVEQSQSGSYHFHLLFLFKGDRLLNDSYRAEQIGQYWSESITEGRGTYFNPHRSADKARHTRLAIGRIEYHEHEKRDNLLNILAYFCKEDQALRVKVSRQSRSYGSSAVPQANRSKGGRPRRYQTDE